MARLLTLTLLAATGIYLRWLALSQTPFANGWDAYYYLIQIRSWIEQGRMHSPEASLIYPLMRGIYALTGDYIMAYKLAASLLAGMFTAAAAVFSYRRVGHVHGAVLIGAWMLFSPMLTWFCAQHPKNLLGLVFLLAFWTLALEQDWRYHIGAVAALAACFFTHKMAFGLAAASAGAYAMARMLEKVPIRIAAVFGLMAVLLTMQLLMRVDANALIPWVEWERFGGELQPRIQFSWWSYWSEGSEAGRLSWWAKIELLFVLPTFVLPLIYWGKPERRADIALYILFTWLFFPFLRWESSGLAWRLFSVAVLLAPLTLQTLFVRLPVSAERLSWACIVAAFFAWKSYIPPKHDPPYARYAKVSDKAMRALNGRPVELMIAHNSLAEFITWRTNVDVLPWIPEYDIPPDRLWRISAGLQPSELRRRIPPGDTVHPLAYGYCLLRERAWQAARRHAEENNDILFLEKTSDWKNPYRTRPAYLLRRKKQ